MSTFHHALLRVRSTAASVQHYTSVYGMQLVHKNTYVKGRGA